MAANWAEKLNRKARFNVTFQTDWIAASWGQTELALQLDRVDLKVSFKHASKTPIRLIAFIVAGIFDGDLGAIGSTLPIVQADFSVLTLASPTIDESF